MLHSITSELWGILYATLQHPADFRQYLSLELPSSIASPKANVEVDRSPRFG